VTPAQSIRECCAPANCDAPRYALACDGAVGDASLPQPARHRNRTGLDRQDAAVDGAVLVVQRQGALLEGPGLGLVDAQCVAVEPEACAVQSSVSWKALNLASISLAKPPGVGGVVLWLVADAALQVVGDRWSGE